MKIFLASFCILAIMCVAILFSACKKSKNNTEVVVKDTWTIINENILTPSCATSGCHSSTTDATYLQHNLVLYISFSRYCAVFGHMRGTSFQLVIAHKLNVCFVTQYHPIAHLFNRVLARAVFLTFGGSGGRSCHG